MGRSDCSLLSTLPQTVSHRLGLLQLLDALHQDRHYATVSSSISDSKLHMALVGRIPVRRWLLRGWYSDGNF